MCVCVCMCLETRGRFQNYLHTVTGDNNDYDYLYNYDYNYLYNTTASSCALNTFPHGKPSVLRQSPCGRRCLPVLRSAACGAGHKLIHTQTRSLERHTRHLRACINACQRAESARARSCTRRTINTRVRVYYACSFCRGSVNTPTNTDAQSHLCGKRYTIYGHHETAAALASCLDVASCSDVAMESRMRSKRLMFTHTKHKVCVRKGVVTYTVAHLTHHYNVVSCR